MKNKPVCLFVFFLLFSCELLKNKNKDRGYIVVVEKEKPWLVQQPFGMVRIPEGSFVLGQSDEDISGQRGVSAPMKTINLSSFFIDDAEITNAQYRKFVFDVRDSIARELLAKKVQELGEQANQEGIGRYAYLVNEQETEELPVYEQYLRNQMEQEERQEEEKKINWEVPLLWDPEQYPDIHYAEVIESLYLPSDLGDIEKRLDPKKITYTYIQQEDGLQRKNTEESLVEKIEIYPDSSRWVKDFPLSYNDPLMREYFEHPAFANHPVVNITWKQAKAFAKWRTEYYRKKNLKNKNLYSTPEYRLPTEFEWEYAARGGLNSASYPWGGPYLQDDRGCFLANFKPSRGNYLESEKGYMYTAKVRSFPPNEYGLYDMSGNVSEWTSSSYALDSYSKISSLNPQIKELTPNSKKVIRGGSWKDVGYYLQVGVRDWEYENSSRSYIGFRTVQSIPPSAKFKGIQRRTP